MEVNPSHALVDQFRETFEGTKPNWITDGDPRTAVLGLVDSLNDEQAHRPPAPGARTAAEHAAHLWYSLDLFLRRARGEEPKAAWETSFELNGRDWTAIKADLRRAYDDCVALISQNRARPLGEWPPIHIAGLAAMTAHNAYHLGAMRQIARVVAGK